jgi:NAD(P)-dependent dehydrogenase (short-subunit alcohol dehydrogenase family)
MASPTNQNQQSKAVLITGCSSGIGQATASHLASTGWRVYATARQRSQLKALEAVGCTPLALDVTDEGSMQAAVAVVEQAEGAVGVLINNAGYSQSGAIEAVPMKKVRAQFETNLFGAVRLMQLVLPGMRRQGFGRIINLSSMGGKLVFPGGGFYHATKYALEAVSDALRFEVKGFGVDVVLIEPGLIRSNFGDAAVSGMNGTEAVDAYSAFHQAVAKATVDAYVKGPLAKLAGSVEDVAKVIAKALRAKHPKPRYTVSGSATLLLTQKSLLTDRAWDRFLGTSFPRPGAEL